jgi:hypothetical protein
LEFFEALNIQKHPILLVTGKTASGKTEFFTSLLSHLVGMETADYSSWAAASPFVLQKSLAINSHLPLVLDEYRELHRDNKPKQEILRSAFNRNTTKKGTKDLGMVGMDVLSTLVLMGEDTPSDPAVQNRCINIVMGTEDKIPKKEWRALQRKCKDWFKFMLFVMNAKIDHEETLKDYDYITDKISCESRVAENYAYLLAVYSSIFLTGSEDKEESLDTMIQHTSRYLREKEGGLSEDQNIEDFIEQAKVAVSKNTRLYLLDYVDVSDNTIKIWIEGIYGILDNGQKDKLLGAGAIRGNLTKECQATRSKQRINGVTRNCYVVEMDNAPDCISDLENYLKEEEEKKDAEELKYNKI